MPDLAVHPVNVDIEFGTPRCCDLVSGNAAAHTIEPTITIEFTVAADDRIPVCEPSCGVKRCGRTAAGIQFYKPADDRPGQK